MVAFHDGLWETPLNRVGMCWSILGALCDSTMWGRDQQIAHRLRDSYKLSQWVRQARDIQVASSTAVWSAIEAYAAW